MLRPGRGDLWAIHGGHDELRGVGPPWVDLGRAGTPARRELHTNRHREADADPRQSVDRVVKLPV
ncbi:MAG: hypothetical protein ACRELZ_22820, partial [Candidatus Rokuibacteriota bacterium]